MRNHRQSSTFDDNDDNDDDHHDNDAAAEHTAPVSDGEEHQPHRGQLVLTPSDRTGGPDRTAWDPPQALATRP
jgi:hypothetical protein